MQHNIITAIALLLVPLLALAKPYALLVKNALMVTMEDTQPEPFLGYLAVDDQGRVFASLVFACSSANVETVFVGGEPVVQRGRPLKLDAQAVARDAKNRVAAMKRRSEAAAPAVSP